MQHDLFSIPTSEASSEVRAIWKQTREGENTSINDSQISGPTHPKGQTKSHIHTYPIVPQLTTHPDGSPRNIATEPHPEAR